MCMKITRTEQYKEQFKNIKAPEEVIKNIAKHVSKNY